MCLCFRICFIQDSIGIVESNFLLSSSDASSQLKSIRPSLASHHFIVLEMEKYSMTEKLTC